MNPMNPLSSIPMDPWLFAILIAIVVFGVVSLVTHGEEDDAIRPPKHVWMVSVSTYTAQEVFDWVVYVTKVTGNRDYLHQMIWDTNAKHHQLLTDLQYGVRFPSDTELKQHFYATAALHGLENTMVDSPY